VLHAEGVVEGWRFHAVDVVVEQRRPLTTGLLAFGWSTALTSTGIRGALREATRLATPQWRPLGLMAALATNQRLLVFRGDTWSSVWYSAIRELIPRPADGQLQLVFESDPPYLLLGESVPYLTVVITTVLARGYGVEAVAGMLRVA
jgi:hypothetical protein